jgi:uncharacterized SAM-dependent methyltransferase
MHLVSMERQQLRINGHSFSMEKGETLHTENSYKYAPEEFLEMASRSRFRALRHWLDDERLFAIYLLEAA